MRFSRFRTDNWRSELEDRQTLAALPVLPMAYSSFSRPAEVDVAWHKTENQGQMGSCRGHSGTSGLERLWFVKNRGDRSAIVQLSEIFFYLAVQKLDGLLGRDVGSTIANGLKLALGVGCPEESLTGYPGFYPGRADRDRILSPANYAAGERFRAKSAWKVSADADLSANFIGGGGVIDFGITYWHGLIPADRIVRSYRVPRQVAGGHAMVALGYKANGNILGVNSHDDGEFQITPDAWRQMVLYEGNAFVGYIGEEEPEPVVDWYHNSPWLK